MQELVYIQKTYQKINEVTLKILNVLVRLWLVTALPVDKKQKRNNFIK